MGDTHTHSDHCTAAADCLALGYADPGDCQAGFCTGTKNSSGEPPTPAPSPVPTDTHTHSDHCTAAADCLALGYDDPGDCQAGFCTGTKTSSGGAPTPAPSPVPTDTHTHSDHCIAAADCLALGYADPGDCQAGFCAGTKTSSGVVWRA
ncbi:hypothetical protein CYMTET_17943 [Cymbomonas tetramitiformis]|uniref:Uncharacterized protein n=1 Tax=Cymbomonas tetramitiformis TaxID=36881 RepID=A0AAE0L6N0_9CHLO|nr:hypothetical protein CYMTET_17943 [Cymbomonas tetramitiformis]